MASIDLRSDTVTKPSDAMREAMLAAVVGDDVYGEDPTVIRLQERAAALVGMQAALFVPSGTMANQIAIRAHTEPGDALMAGRDAHVYLYEGGGAAALSGVQAVLVGEGGLFGADDVRMAIAPADSHFARTRLVCVENTHNRSGGRVFPMADQIAVAEVARDAGLALHLDGARIFNASIASGLSTAELAAPFDSVAFCLSKGLGAPVGSLICGSQGFIHRAHRFRKLFGGGMRQAGILAAAGLHALDHNVDRLADDHAHARTLATLLEKVEGIDVLAVPETNMLLVRVGRAEPFIEALLVRDVAVGAVDASTLRVVTHLDVSLPDVECAAVAFQEAAASLNA
ncbi:MAG: low-specificity L-threonine aldolase [Deltaproteobacteria bacterium]|jgi:threonine aldolase|nr:low-specificity L-threonine aldolase [Deltaproteobacteria bacterium]MBW2383647.1 low-specificity L-threonine aldolase [Deltaproteobacteria bacterium]MBW2696827.1 low-specificity L-threonine aldolase [Deltaproteobacteria bacterium]